ncbi:hypothetical protein DFH06DRAFT_1207169 [Mycena polygramma]|nr:hypothetical protein DFH06DRAFT_1207169 [Mycena polygramma]
MASNLLTALLLEHCEFETAAALEPVHDTMTAAELCEPVGHTTGISLTMALNCSTSSKSSTFSSGFRSITSSSKEIERWYASTIAMVSRSASSSLTAICAASSARLSVWRIFSEGTLALPYMRGSCVPFVNLSIYYLYCPAIWQNQRP